MDGIQILLIVVVVTLTVLLALVGLQVFLILLDLRKGIRKINTILDDSILGGGLIRSEKLAGILELFRKGKKNEMKS
jgi:hypothetical protein